MTEEKKTPAPATPAPAKSDEAAAKAAAEAAALKAEQEAKDKAAFEAALAEKDNQLTPEQAKSLEELNGDAPESDAEQDAVINPNVRSGIPEELATVFDKLRRLNQAIPATSPDSHSIWGAAGVILTLGDIRTIIRYAR